MNLGDLPIPPALREAYQRLGIVGLYPPQAECVSAGMFEGRNLLVSIPTASGKTLVAEMAMHAHISRGGKCLYIVPLRALASEKFAEFSGKGVAVGIATGDYDRRDDLLGKNGIIVATSEKVDSLLRNKSPWLREITLLVIDEIHLIDEGGRGPTLEMVITKLRFLSPRLQVIGLSATIGNPSTLASWLDATPVTSTWRPVDLRQGVFCQGTIRFSEEEVRIEPRTRNDDVNLCLDAIASGGQCLVFVSSRRNAEAFAKRAASALKKTITSSENDLDVYSQRVAGLSDGDADPDLAACIKGGAAFHHAGLARDARAAVEEGFRKGHIRIIASTPTLAAGLNLPARRVIIRDYLRYTHGEGMVPIPIREYHQMAGRAGRPRLDPYGEAILLARDEHEAAQLAEWYIESPPEDVHSQCAAEGVLLTHILSLIAADFCRSRDEISSFMGRTFYHYERKSGRLIERVLDRDLRFLASAEMIMDYGDRLSATEFGELVSQLYIDPRSAEQIASVMSGRTEYSDLGLLHLICLTRDMPTLHINNRDIYMLEKFLHEHEDEIWCEPPLEGEEEYFRALKTAMLLSDWTAEVPDPQIHERFSVGPGDVYAYVESMNWLLHASSRLAPMFKRAFVVPIREYEVCMRGGVKRELVPLVRLRHVGRVRARRLFNAGLTTPEEIRQAGRDRVASILGRGVADLIFQSLGTDPPPSPVRPTPGAGGAPNQQTLSDFR